MARRGDDNRRRRRRGNRPREVLPGDGIGFWLKGTDLAPEDDPAWLELPADHPGRRAFWEFAAELGMEFYASEREKGRDAVGRKLRRLSEKTIENRESAMGTADPKAPPLVPAHGLSRTVSLLRYSIRKDGIWYYWAWDGHTRGNWGSILIRHKIGRDVPRRDVIGLAKRARNAIRMRALKWWLLKRKAYAPDTAAEYGWTPPGVGREFFRPRSITTMDGSIEGEREGWYQDVAKKKRQSPRPSWRDELDRRMAGMTAYTLEGTNQLRARQGLPPLAAPPEVPQPTLRLVRPPRPEPPVVPPVIEPPTLTKPEPVEVPAVVTPPEPSPLTQSNAAVVLHDRAEVVDAIIDAMGGEAVTPEELAALIGAPDNATVRFDPGPGGTVRFSVSAEGVEAFAGRISRVGYTTVLVVERFEVSPGAAGRAVGELIRSRIGEWSRYYRLGQVRWAD